MSDTNSDSDDSQEYVSVPMSPRIESSRDFEMEHTLDDSESRGEEPNSNKDKESPKQDVFRVLVTGFGVSFDQHIIAIVLMASAVRSMGSQPILARSPAFAQ